ncbi:hypothetical protein NLG97_g121 [Lecanicillium saksenae]|uniref:Uncharacterized protein n=1 Tax=Lecanicillium saksenae TaxID=468837 RepID=A0ACC1RAY7_9HYPO|nr:hypothetical protein NLG97_g121 [Lecanicillium saksenae]
MATQSNLDHQTFWEPRPVSRPRCEGQLRVRPPLPQPKASPLPLNDSHAMIGMLQESPDSLPRLTFSRDDVIYISDDAASDINGASYEPFDETLPPIQAIMQSLEHAWGMGNIDDGFVQTSQRKDAHEESGRSTNSTPPEQELLNDSPRPTVDIAAECSVGVSASTSRMSTSAPTSMADESRIGSWACKSSLRDADSPHARACSVLAEHEGTKKPSPEIPQPVDSQVYPPSSASQSQRQASPPDDDCDRVGMTPGGLSGSSQTVVSSKGDSFDVFDTTFDPPHTLCSVSADETPPSARTAAGPKDDTGEIRSTVGDEGRLLNSKDEQEPSHGPHSSALLDRTHIQHSARFSFAEAADCLTEVASSVPRTRSSTASTPASSRLNSLSPESHAWDTLSTRTSCTSLSVPGSDKDDLDDQICTGTTTSEKVGNDLSEREYTCDEEPLMSQMLLQARNKRLRESLANHGTEQLEVGGLHGALDDPEYCPVPGDESNADDDGLSGDEEQASRKRRKFRTGLSKNESRSRQSAHSEPAVLDQASELISATKEDAPAMAEPTDAAFDEWILQDVVLKRTIMDGKATFHFQFDWDLCAEHGQAARKPRKQPKQQGQAKPGVKNTGRRRFTALEDRWLVTWKEQQGLCWAEIHSHFCDKFEERSKEALQVRYCTRLKQRDDD